MESGMKVIVRAALVGLLALVAQVSMGCSARPGERSLRAAKSDQKPDGFSGEQVQPEDNKPVSEQYPSVEPSEKSGQDDSVPVGIPVQDNPDTDNSNKYIQAPQKSGQDDSVPVGIPVQDNPDADNSNAAGGPQGGGAAQAAGGPQSQGCDAEQAAGAPQGGDVAEAQKKCSAIAKKMTKKMTEKMTEKMTKTFELDVDGTMYQFDGDIWKLANPDEVANWPRLLDRLKLCEAPYVIATKPFTIQSKSLIDGTPEAFTIPEGSKGEVKRITADGLEVNWVYRGKDISWDSREPHIPSEMLKNLEPVGKTYYQRVGECGVISTGAVVGGTVVAGVLAAVQGCTPVPVGLGGTVGALCGAWAGYGAADQCRINGGQLC